MSINMIIILLGAGLMTYCTRFPLMILSGTKEISPKLTKFMSFIAPAVLTSLIVPAIFVNEGKVDFSLDNKYMIAAVITVIAAYFSKNMLVSVITGVCSVGILMYIL